MIINFLSPCWQFFAIEPISRGTQVKPPHIIGFNLMMIVVPGDIQPGDVLTVDLRNGNVEIVQRASIAIWRSGWLN